MHSQTLIGWIDTAAVSSITYAVVRLLTRLLVVIALCSAIGLQWVAVQSVAWTTMLIDNVRVFPIGEAVAKTFDGQHPCNLCLVAQTGQRQEKKPEVQVVRAKIDLICTARPLPPQTSFETIRYLAHGVAVLARAQSPAVPPPRVALR